MHVAPCRPNTNRLLVPVLHEIVTPGSGVGVMVAVGTVVAVGGAACWVNCCAACAVPATAVSMLTGLPAGAGCGAWPGSTQAMSARRTANALQV